MKVGIILFLKNKILLYSWLPAGTTYHKNMAIWNFTNIL
jgi:hypothetical protein